MILDVEVYLMKKNESIIIYFYASFVHNQAKIPMGYSSEIHKFCRKHDFITCHFYPW
jgi:hypothetical protein